MIDLNRLPSWQKDWLLNRDRQPSDFVRKLALNIIYGRPLPKPPQDEPPAA